MKWHSAFSHAPSFRCLDNGHLLPTNVLRDFEHLKTYLEYIHIKFCLLKPFCELKNYPLVDARDLLPSFEPNLYEFAELPGFSMVVFNRSLDYFNEVFQFDLLHTCRDTDCGANGQICVLEDVLQRKNLETFLRRLPRHAREEFKTATAERQISDIASYSLLIHYLSHMDRAHVLAQDCGGNFYLSGIYASLPSDLDTELKRFGLKSKKFRPNDNHSYEANRDFVYQFLMELYGYPISSERKTSAAIFARRLHKMGERFLVKVLGQSDRTLTSIHSTKPSLHYPHVEKAALVRLETANAETIQFLERGGFFVDVKKRVVILRVLYRQHKFDPNNVRQDRALSVARQDILHPLTGAACSSVNVIKDSYSMSLKLNDIVRGEFEGRTLFKGSEIVENTDSHAKRLKFLHSWLNKHQRRLIGYSDEFYREITHVLDGYLSNPDFADDFTELHDVYSEVRSSYSYINQARNIKQLEDLSSRYHKGKRIGYKEMLLIGTELLTNLKFEFINYYEQLVFKAIYFAESILNDRYLIRSYINRKDDQLTDNGLQIKKLYRRLVSLVDELRAIRKTKGD
jgi:hypothetical protein